LLTSNMTERAAPVSTSMSSFCPFKVNRVRGMSVYSVKSKVIITAIGQTVVSSYKW